MDDVFSGGLLRSSEKHSTTFKRYDDGVGGRAILQRQSLLWYGSVLTQLQFSETVIYARDYSLPSICPVQNTVVIENRLVPLQAKQSKNASDDI